MNAQLATPPTLTRQAGAWQGWIIVLTGQLPMIAIVALMPALPTLMEHFKGVPHGELLIPMILTAPGLCIALLAPFAGYFVDRFGRRRLLIPFMVLYGLGGILPFFLDGFTTVITGRLLLGVGECFLLVIGNTLLGDYFSPAQRANWLTVQAVAGAVLAAGLLSLSGRLASLGWNYPFLVYGLAFIIALLAWLFIFEPAQPTSLAAESNAPRAAFPLRTVLLVFGVTLLVSMVYYVYTIQISLVLDELGVKDKIQLGNYSALASTGVPVGGLLFKVVAKRPFWVHLAMIVGFFAVGLLGIGLTLSPPVAVAFGWVQQLGCGMTVSALIAWALHILPVSYRGRGMGFWTSGFFLGLFLSPLFVSLLRTFTGGLLAVFRATGFFCAVVVVLLVLYHLLLPKQRPAEAVATL